MTDSFECCSKDLNVIWSFSFQQSADAGRRSIWKDQDSAALRHAASPVQTPGDVTNAGGWTRWYYVARTVGRHKLRQSLKIDFSTVSATIISTHSTESNTSRTFVLLLNFQSHHCDHWLPIYTSRVKVWVPKSKVSNKEGYVYRSLLHNKCISVSINVYIFDPS